jgi:hypothetical protein
MVFIQITENPVGYTVSVLPSVPSTQAYHVPGTDGVVTYAPHRLALMDEPMVQLVGGVVRDVEKPNCTGALLGET